MTLAAPVKVFCATLGCDKNLVDSEALLGKFALKGVTAVNDLEAADIWILNTCGFIDAARSDSAEALQQLIDMKQEQTLVVCGCWSQEHAESIKSSFPEVDVVAGVGQFDEVVTACLGGVAAEESTSVPASAAVDFPLAGPPIVQPPDEVHYTGLVDRPLLTPAHVAFVKISEGCNFSCAFCRIPLIRGKQQSRSIAEICREVETLVGRGVSEIQIVSQNTSDFGRDTGENLHDLVAALGMVDGLRSMRLLYIYAGLVSVEGLLRLLDLPKVAPYLDIPIQHASSRLLKAMKRPGGPESNLRFFKELRQARPDLVLRSTALLGFPGEEEEDVSQLADFLAEVRFDHLGTYRYSPETGTAAAEMEDDLPGEVILDREALIADLQADISLERQTGRLGKEYDLVIDRLIPTRGQEFEEIESVLESLDQGTWAGEGRPEDFLTSILQTESVAVGRSYHFGYDLDGMVLLSGEGLRQGQWVRARFAAVTPYDVWGVASNGSV